MVSVSIDGLRIGTVSRFRGEPPSRQWVAYSLYRLEGDRENSKPFATKKAAIAWLEQQHAAQTPKVSA